MKMKCNKCEYESSGAKITPCPRCGYNCLSEVCVKMPSLNKRKSKIHSSVSAVAILGFMICVLNGMITIGIMGILLSLLYMTVVRFFIFKDGY